METTTVESLKIRKPFPIIKIVEHRNTLSNATSSAKHISILSMNVPPMGKQNPEHKGFLNSSFFLVICFCMKYLFDCPNIKKAQ